MFSGVRIPRRSNCFRGDRGAPYSTHCKNNTMRVLLLGDYSNVHATLAKGLREEGVEVILASDGDGWKNYPRDIDLQRKSLMGVYSIKWILDIVRKFRHFKGYDVVQIINPVFLQLSGKRMWPFYRFLRRHNRSVFMGAFGMDHYWVKAGLDGRTFRYSDFNFGSLQRRGGTNEHFIADWLEGEKGRLNRHIAADCDGIVAGLYEYWESYRTHCPEAQGKLTYIPFPIVVPEGHVAPHTSDRLRCRIDIQRERSVFMGTDIMLRALERLEKTYPQEVEVVKVENVPYAKYVRMLEDSDVILDQLYSYTPAMNALQAMAEGLIVVGGAEPEYYRLTERQEPNTTHLRPIINVIPQEESVYRELEDLILKQQTVNRLRNQSREFVRKHHDYRKVARQYLDFWQSTITAKG